MTCGAADGSCTRSFVRTKHVPLSRSLDGTVSTLVDSRGVEPLTSCLPDKRSPS